MEIRREQCDVAVIGGGPGGLAAALAAARHGAKVLLAERNGYLGGNAVTGLPLLGYLSQQGEQIIGGIAQELIDELEKQGGSFGHSRCPMHNSVTLIHPELFKLLALRLCLEAGIKLLFHSEVCDTVVNNGRLTQVSVMGKGTRTDITADIYVDGTGDGDLGFLAGAKYEKGNRDGMLQPPTVMFSLTGFEEEEFFRFLDAHPENMKLPDTVKNDDGYDTSLWRSTPNHVFVGMGAYLNELRKKTDCPVLRENIIYINSTIPGKIFVNTVRVPGCDGSDIQSLTDGEIAGQLQIPGIVKMLRDYVPGFEHCQLDQIAPAIGIRESRRFHGIGRLTGEDVLAGRRPADTVALGGYKVDIHNGNGEGTILQKVEKPYGIPLGAVISADIEGLLFTGRCISMDHEALASARVMPTCMAVGQAAGTLAAQAIRDGVSCRDVPAQTVIRTLRADGAILD